MVIDSGQKTLHLFVVAESGARVLKKKLRRKQLLE
jgi:hypothetical protein